MRGWLKKLRTEAGITQAGMAATLGMTQAAYSKIENLKRCEDLPISLAQKIGDTFDISLEQIAKYENERISA